MRRVAPKTAKGAVASYRKFKATELVTAANKIPCPLSVVADSVDMFKPKRANLDVRLECSRPHTLNSEILDDLFFILKHNMEKLYMQSDWGWDEKKKRDEVFSPKSRVLICYVFGLTHDDEEVERIAGFVSFRFEREDEHPVLYCYEIQLREEYRGQSIGRYMMNALSLVASSTRMHRVLLTVFKANTKALHFFKQLGFQTDETDPSNFKDSPKVDYEILSKRCERLSIT
ncbi:unnamed protein product [Calicophoron daubneyi]|uniref:N-alpha-acetyltransferase 40 n=1 Tax=Calicophoron daubneyi TaxID=300641 RepID=A0AAV2T7D3_CALDB